MCDKQTAMQFTQVLENIGEYYDRIFNSMLRTMIGDYKPQVCWHSDAIHSLLGLVNCSVRCHQQVAPKIKPLNPQNIEQLLPNKTPCFYVASFY